MSFCLKDYVGIDGCERAAPLSGLYVNRLPGVSLKSIKALANEEQVTYLEVYDNIQDRAEVQFYADITQEFNKRFRLRTVADSANLGDVLSLTSNTPKSDQYRGWTCDLTYGSNIWTSSQLAIIHVQQISFFLENPVSGLEVIIQDIIRGKTLYTTTIDGVIGWNYIDIEQDFQTYRIFVGYKSTDIDSVTHTLPINIQNIFSTFLGGSIFGGNGKALFYGTTYDRAPNTLGPYTQNTYGMSGIMTIACTYASIVCNNKRTFADAWWYLLGIEMITESLYTDKINKWSTIDRDKRGQLRNEMRQMYEMKLEQAVKGINLSTGDNCLECDQQVQTAWVTPYGGQGRVGGIL